MRINNALNSSKVNALQPPQSPVSQISEKISKRTIERDRERLVDIHSFATERRVLRSQKIETLNDKNELRRRYILRDSLIWKVCCLGVLLENGERILN